MRVLRFLRDNPRMATGMGMMGLMILFWLVGLLTIGTSKAVPLSGPPDMMPSAQYPLGTDSAGRQLLPVLIAWDSGMLIRQYLDPETGSDLLIFSVIVVLVASLLVPSYIAVFRYGYRSPALWTSRI